MILRNIIGKSIAASVAVLFLFACTNDPNEVKKITRSEELPLEVQEDLVLTYSDSTYLRLQLEAPLAENFPQIEDPQRRFPKGIDVKFFDSFGKENTRLKANRAIQYVNQNLWHATGDVVVVNKKGEQLNTEELYWDQAKEIIYSEVQVKITTDKEIIWGEGFEADQDFNSYTLNKITGQISIEDEEDA